MMGILFGEEQAGRGAIHERAMLVLLVEAAAARRKQGQLPAQSWWGEGDPPGQGGWRDEDPPGDAVLLTPVPMGPTTPRSPEARNRQQKTPHSHRIGPEVFLNCSTDGQGSKDTGHHKPTNRSSQNPERGRGRQGTGQEATHRNFLGPHSLNPPIKKGPSGAEQQEGPPMPTQNRRNRKPPGDP